jgi:HlyD family secretion protein
MNFRKWLSRKHIIWSVIILLVIAGILRVFVFKKADTGNILIDTVKRQDIKQTVLATGQVTSSTDLDLAFKLSGIVQRINVKVGDKAANGQVLATLDQRDQLASLTSARGTAAAAQANYQKVLDGASSQEVAVAQAGVDAAQVTLDNAQNNVTDTKNQQAVLVANAYKALLNSTLQAIPKSTNQGTAPAISGAYSGSAAGTYEIRFLVTSGGYTYLVSGLESMEGTITSGSFSPIGTRGVYAQFPVTNYANDVWDIDIPNTKAPNYVANLNAYNAAVQNQTAAVAAADNSVAAAQSALDQAKAQLDLKRAQARPADIQAAQAQILSAQGQLQQASAALENTQIRAPVGGTITAVDIKVGEQASALKEVIVLQDVGNLHVEANISEANIASLQLGQKVDITFDALGPDRHFTAAVAAIDPASTVVSGVVNYKITASLDKSDDIKPGMTANMSIVVAEKPGVLTVPLRAVLNNNGKKTIRVIDDPKKKTYHEADVTTGLEADGGVVEILSGLNEGQEIVTFINKK